MAVARRLDGDSAIPLVDLAGLDGGGSGRLDEIAAALRFALERIGFMIIVNHGVERSLVERTFAEARRFHAMPLADKLAVRMNAHNNGYMAISRYNVRTSRVSETTARPDLNEAFFCKRERGPDDPMVRAGRRFSGPNRWPDGLPGFREAVLRYTDRIDRLGRSLLPALARALDLPDDRFDASFTRSHFSFRMSHYPQAAARPDGQYGIAPHTDANFMTFLAQSGVPGLQIQMPSGGWADVPHVPDSFVVNVGDMLHRWTNGRFHSTAHRALPPTEGPRYAIPYFLGPNLDAEIRCLPSCQGPDDPPRYPPIVYEDYISWWYDSNYPPGDQDDVTAAAG